MQRRTFITSIAAGSAPAIPATTLAQDASPPAAEAWPTAPGLVDSGYAPVNGLEIYYGILGSDRGNMPLLIMHGAYMNVDAMLQIISPPRHRLRRGQALGRIRGGRTPGAQRR